MPSKSPRSISVASELQIGQRVTVRPSTPVAQLGCWQNVLPHSQAALRRNEALNRACQHEKQSLACRRKISDDLFRGDLNPRLVQPRVPGILWMWTTVAFHLELGPYDIGLATAVERLGISVGM